MQWIEKINFQLTIYSITFICSKTDNINKTEILNNINLILKNNNLITELNKYNSKRKKIQNRFTILEKKQNIIFNIKDSLNMQIEKLKNPHNQTRREKTIFDLLGSKNKYKILIKSNRQKKQICLNINNEIANITENIIPN